MVTFNVKSIVTSPWANGFRAPSVGRGSITPDRTSLWPSLAQHVYAALYASQNKARNQHSTALSPAAKLNWLNCEKFYRSPIKMLWFAAIACEFSSTSSCYWPGYDITAAVLALRMSIFLAQRNLFACLRICHIENTFRFHFLRARKIKV